VSGLSGTCHEPGKEITGRIHRCAARHRCVLQVMMIRLLLQVRKLDSTMLILVGSMW